MNYATILVPFDGSELAEQAITEAVTLARPHGARIILLGVMEVPTAQFEGYAEFISGVDIHDKMRDHLNGLLTGHAERLRAQGLHTDTQVRQGIPHEEIAAACNEEKVDVIVMTTHGRSGFAHFLLGSVAEKVVRTAPCSVMIVRPGRE